METDVFEIERKFLVAYPELSWLSAVAESSQIVQTYLSGGPPGCSERVRERRFKNATVYTHTIKRRISDMRRIEDESEVNQGEYERLLCRADPNKRQIIKTRFCLPYKGNLLEIDIFPFWTDRAFLEIELKEEAMSFILPPEIVVIREVTSDKRYTNSSLAKRIPMDDLG